MMKSTFRKALIAAAAAGTLGLGANTANAAILFDAWSLNVGGIDGIAAGTGATGIQQIIYSGIFDSDLGGGGVYTIDGLINSENFKRANGSTIGGTGLNNTWEMTFAFSVQANTTSINTSAPHSPTQPLVAFGHDAGIGTLDVYIDGLGAADPNQSNFGSAGSYKTDGGGTLIGSFQLLPGGGGSINFLSDVLTGADTTEWRATSLLGGVWFGDDGTDLSTLLDANGDPLTIAIVGSDLDVDLDQNGLIDSNFGAFAQCGTDFTSFCGTDDGSARIGRIPEPATAALLGFGLLGLGAAVRRRKAKS